MRACSAGRMQHPLSALTFYRWTMGSTTSGMRTHGWREEYVRGNLTAEEFLRKIDTIHELMSCEVDKINLPDEPSMWQQLVERDFRFDPERYCPIELGRLDLSCPDPRWQILTADDLRREPQKGYQSLKKKYGK